MLILALALALAPAGDEPKPDAGAAAPAMPPRANVAPDARLVAPNGVTRVTVAASECDDPSDFGKPLAFDGETYACGKASGGIIQWEKRSETRAALDGVDWWKVATGVALLFVLPFLGFVAGKRAQAIRSDGDPTNDWQADILEGAAMLFNQASAAYGAGDKKKGDELYAKARAEEARAKARKPR